MTSQACKRESLSSDRRQRRERKGKPERERERCLESHVNIMSIYNNVYNEKRLYLLQLKVDVTLSPLFQRNIISIDRSHTRIHKPS